VSTHFNKSPRGARDGDFTGDTLVNVSDLGVVSTHFNKTLPAGSPAPAAGTLRPGRSALFSRTPIRLTPGRALVDLAAILG
jgi:hypothetical protein